MSLSPMPVRVFMACTGLGQVHRGFESFTAECHAAIAGDPALTVRLFSGGPATAACRLPSLNRHSTAARMLGRMIGRADGYRIEQATFAAALVPHLVARRPDVVFLSDIPLARLLARVRRVLGMPYRILLSNGGLAGPPYEPFDHVQQLAPAHLEQAVQRGLAPERQTLLPYGIHPARPATPGPERDAWRRRLNLSVERPVLISVAAMDRRQKRLHVLIDGVAGLEPEQRPLLVLLGQPERETATILSLAGARLGSDGFVARTVAPAEVDGYLRAADAFVLSSLVEGLPRAVLEAAVRGLPCLLHDCAVNRFVLGDYGIYVDAGRPGELSAGVPVALAAARSPTPRSDQAAWIAERFSWERLAPRYVEMLCQVAARRARPGA